MSVETLKQWTGSLGKKYLERNPKSDAEMNNLYRNKFGIDREQMNQQFFSETNVQLSRILEVGCNMGIQLAILSKLFQAKLYGVEPFEAARQGGLKIHPYLNIVLGDSSDVPFKSSYFDMVFTSGVLIHINPEDYEATTREIARCSKRYIWGFEYYSPEVKEIEYRGQSGLLWANNFAEVYQHHNPYLTLILERFYTDNESHISQMFLLEKNPC